MVDYNRPKADIEKTGGMDYMNHYHENVLSVLSFLSDMDFCDAIITDHKKCYQRLRAYFQDLHQPVYFPNQWSKTTAFRR